MHTIGLGSVPMRSINPDYHDSLMALGSLLADTGRVEEGWPYMQRAADVAPDNPIVLNNLGAYFFRIGKPPLLLLTLCQLKVSVLPMQVEVKKQLRHTIKSSV